MYGADADQLDALATELEGYRNELGSLLTQGVGSVSLLGLSATLHSIWQGPRSREFSAIWQSRHLLQVRGVQDLLAEAIKDLRANAEQQRITSAGASGSGGIAIAPIGGAATTGQVAASVWPSWLELGEIYHGFPVEGILLFHSRFAIRGANGAFLSPQSLSRTQLFTNVFRRGYTVPKAGHAGQGASWGGWAGRLGFAAAAYEGIKSGWEEWNESGEDPSRSDLIRADRAVTVGGATAAGAWGGAALGAKGGAATGAVIGSFFGPGPGTAIGAAVGGIVGGGIGAWAGTELGQEVGGHIADLRESAFEAAEDFGRELGQDLAPLAQSAVNIGAATAGQAIDTVGDVLSGGASVVSGAAAALSFWN
jgi:uncharacterized protein YukE